MHSGYSFRPIRWIRIWIHMCTATNQCDHWRIRMHKVWSCLTKDEIEFANVQFRFFGTKLNLTNVEFRGKMFLEIEQETYITCEVENATVLGCASVYPPFHLVLRIYHLTKELALSCPKNMANKVSVRICSQLIVRAVTSSVYSPCGKTIEQKARHSLLV